MATENFYRVTVLAAGVFLGVGSVYAQSLDSGLADQSLNNSPYSTASPFGTTAAPIYQSTIGNPYVSSPAGNPSGPQAPVQSVTNPADEDVVSGATTSSQAVPRGNGATTRQPSTAVPSAPANGGTTSGATTGSSSTTPGL